ncbi:MAG: hypothetical protein AAB343_00540 [Patescibacteria group bacterium]
MDQFEEFMPDEVEETETEALEKALVVEKNAEDAEDVLDEDLI